MGSRPVAPEPASSVTFPHNHAEIFSLSTIWTTNRFEAVWLLTGGGPSNASMTFPVLAYYGLQSMRIGESAAVAVALLPVLAVLAFIVAIRLQKET